MVVLGHKVGGRTHHDCEGFMLWQAMVLRDHLENAERCSATSSPLRLLGNADEKPGHGNESLLGGVEVVVIGNF